MWTAAHIVAEYEIDGPAVAITLTTPAGVVTILGEMTIVDDELHIIRAHIGGLSPGALGRRGLNAIGRKLLEMANVKKIVIQGSARTTGKRNGRIPWKICFPHGQAPLEGSRYQAACRFRSPANSTWDFASQSA
jgi:hypothetical protein